MRARLGYIVRPYLKPQQKYTEMFSTVGFPTLTCGAGTFEIICPSPHAYSFLTVPHTKNTTVSGPLSLSLTQMFFPGSQHFSLPYFIHGSTQSLLDGQVFPWLLYLKQHSLYHSVCLFPTRIKTQESSDFLVCLQWPLIHRGTQMWAEVMNEFIIHRLYANAMNICWMDGWMDGPPTTLSSSRSILDLSRKSFIK